MAVTGNIDDTNPTQPATNRNDRPILIVPTEQERDQIVDNDGEKRPLAPIRLMIIGGLMWAGLFLLVYALIQIF